MENVQRLAGSCLDGSFGGNRTIREPGKGESLLRRKRKSEGDEQISRRSSLYPRDLKPNGAAVDPLKNGFTTCCWQSHLKIPLDIERISEKESDTPTRRSASVSQYLVNIKVRISSRRLPEERKKKRLYFAVCIFLLSSLIDSHYILTNQQLYYYCYY